MEYIKQNWNKLFIVVLCVVVLFAAFGSGVDSKGEELVESSFTQALIVFGSAKGLNAVISLAQGTQLDLPFLTVAIGEVLDPINDLVEQFAWVMLASMASLGIQKILLSFTASGIYNIVLAFCLVVVNLWLFFRFSKDKELRTIFFKVTAVLLFLRFAVPLMGYVNFVVYENFVKPKYNIETLNNKIEIVRDEVDKVTNETLQKKQDDSFFDKVTKSLDRDFYMQKIEQYKDAANNASRYVIDLIIVFIFQTIFLPLLFLFVLYHFTRSIFAIGKSSNLTRDQAE